MYSIHSYGVSTLYFPLCRRRMEEWQEYTWILKCQTYYEKAIELADILVSVGMKKQFLNMLKLCMNKAQVQQVAKLFLCHKDPSAGRSNPLAFPWTYTVEELTSKVKTLVIWYKLSSVVYMCNQCPIK